MLKVSMILIIFFLVSCNRNNRESISQEQYVGNNIFIIETVDIEILETENVIENSDTLEISADLPRIMFVTAEAGLRIRSEPSVQGDIMGLFLHGSRIIITERSETIDTIGDISDYWFRINDYRFPEGWVTGWVFGGFISNVFPENLPIILGLWDDINSPFISWPDGVSHFRVGYRFRPNFSFSFFIKETGHVVRGSWEINEDIIRIFDIIYTEGHIGVDYTEEFIQLEIIDNDNIVLTFLNNTAPAFYNNSKTVELRRSPDIWW